MAQNPGRQSRTYELVARTDGRVYSMKLPKEKTWRHISEKPIQAYTPFKNYTPHHLKNLRRGCKLFLRDHWPAFAKRLEYLEAAGVAD